MIVDPPTYEFAYDIMFSCEKSLEKVTAVLPIPSESTVWRHYDERASIIKKALTSCRGLSSIINTLGYPTNKSFETENRIFTDQVYGTIAIDAGQVDQWSGCKPDIECNYIFTLYFMPLNADLPRSILGHFHFVMESANMKFFQK